MKVIVPISLLRKLISCFLILAVFSGCNVQLVGPYDEVIDNGLKEYKEEINTFIKNMGDLGGSDEGTFESNMDKYNELEAKIELLIDRANLQSTGSCKMVTDITSKIQKIMGDNMPQELVSEKQRDNGNSFGCIEKLLILVKDQLIILKKIHKETDKCKDDLGKEFSCIREATSKTALDITNQSINAAWVVETTKKNAK